MSNNELLMMLYRMGNHHGCLVLKLPGKPPFKILKILEPLYFVGWMKQLSMAIDTGADQNCSYHLKCLDNVERLLKCRFVQEMVALELWALQKSKFSWKGTAKEFKAAVDRMITKLPKFFS